MEVRVQSWKMWRNHYYIDNIIIFPGILDSHVKCSCFLWSCLSNSTQQHTNKPHLPPVFFLFIQFSISWFLTDSFFLPQIYFRTSLIIRSHNRQWNESGRLCSHLAWCQTGVLLGVALINSSLLFYWSFYPSLCSTDGLRAGEQSHIKDGNFSQTGIFSSFFVHFSYLLLRFELSFFLMTI